MSIVHSQRSDELAVLMSRHGCRTVQCDHLLHGGSRLTLLLDGRYGSIDTICFLYRRDEPRTLYVCVEDILTALSLVEKQ